MVTYTITEGIEEDLKGGEQIARTVDHLHLPELKESNPMSLKHDITMRAEVRASFDFQGSAFTVEVTCKDVPEDVLMDEMERVQSVLQDRVDQLHEPAQEHLDHLLNARGERS